MYPEVIRYGELVLDVGGFKLLHRDRSKYLTSQQTRLLAMLMAEPTRVHSNKLLAAALTGNSVKADAALKVCISRIRRSIWALGCVDEYLLSVRGFGYIFDPTAVRHKEP